MYKGRGNRHEIEIAGQLLWVDSNQEEVLLRWLEANGFEELWTRFDHGIKSGKSNYTPDLELSIFLDGKTHRALVESKPSLSFFSKYIAKRMRGSARYYLTEVLLLYVHDTQTWYRVDNKTGTISEFGVPKPGLIKIKKLYKPLSKQAPSVYSHQYRERLSPVKELSKVLANTTAELLQSSLGKPVKKRRRRKR